MKDIASKDKVAINSVRTLIEKLYSFSKLAMLPNLTPLLTILSNVTRWSSTSDILRRYLIIRDFIGFLRVLRYMTVRFKERNTRQWCTFVGKR